MKKSEVYSGKTGALREGDTTHRRSDPRDGDIQADSSRNEYAYMRISAEEAEAGLDNAGVDELVGRLMGSPSECFIHLYISCMNSSSSAGDSGMFEDRREQATEKR